MSNPSKPTRQSNQINIESAPTFLSLPKQYIGVLKTDTPSVQNILYFYSHLDPTTVLAFKNGQDGQTIRILGNGNTTVEDNAVIKTNVGIDKVLLADLVYVFTYFDGIWYEDS